MKQGNTLMKNKYLYILTILVVIGLISIYMYFANIAYTISIDNKLIGIVKEKEEISKLLDEIQTEMKNKLENDVLITQTISIEKTRASKEKLTPINSIKNNLYKTLDFKINGYSIKVNGKDLLFLQTKNDAETLLDNIKNKYASFNENIQEVSFVEDVDIEPKEINVEDLMTPEDALNYILTGGEKVQKYKVRTGDTAWDIAMRYDLSLEDLEIANPAVDLDRLQIGQLLNLNIPKPYINVKTSVIKTYEEIIPFKLVYEKSDSIYIGDRKIKSNGKEGKKQVEAELIYINGILDNQKIIKEKILKEPINAIVLKGTKERPKTLAYGSFYNPARGKLTSRFGWRWGKKHEGIDISGPVGTPIKAADGGKVITAGWLTGYGKTVIIDHENGYKTLYAHANTLKVKIGQRVYRGQVIATIGTTGRTTGPNVHFEVRKNNVPVDPLKYLKY